MKVCSVEGCNEKVSARGYCQKHYNAMWYKTSSEREGPRCSIEGCNKRADIKGYCRKHYEYFKFKNKELRDVPNCKVEGCDRKSFKKGMCDKHYQAATYDKKNKKKWNKKYIETEKGRDAVKRGSHTYRARKRNALVEFFSPAKVYERDFYVCCVCGLPINPALQHPDECSVSLEHKKPLSKGGEHSFDNCAPSHLICNLRKRDKLIQPSFEGASI